MVNKILTESGFAINKTYKECRFIKPPNTTYAVYLDSFSCNGADDVNLIKDHDYTIELYEYSPDPDAERRIEDSFDNEGISYDKQERTWLESEGLYQVIYDFSYIEKINRR